MCSLSVPFINLVDAVDILEPMTILMPVPVIMFCTVDINEINFVYLKNLSLTDAVLAG